MRANAATLEELILLMIDMLLNGDTLTYETVEGSRRPVIWRTTPLGKTSMVYRFTGPQAFEDGGSIGPNDAVRLIQADGFEVEAIGASYRPPRTEVQALSYLEIWEQLKTKNGAH